MSSPLLVCRIAWMDLYRGVTPRDVPTGGGTWVKEHGFGHEVFNFEPVRGEYFGYVRPSKGFGINLRRLGARTARAQLGGVTVVWVARHPTEGGTRIVGWYNNATVFASYQHPAPTSRRRLPDGDTPHYLIRARDAVLLDRDERTFEVPRGKGAMGQSNVWYPPPAAAARINFYVRSGGRAPARGRPASALLTDVARRLRIEKVAMDAAAEWFIKRGYDVKDVSMARVGWDLQADRSRSTLKVEVKGTCLDVPTRHFTIFGCKISAVNIDNN